MKAIVTGSSGFIGAALTQKLLDEGWEVWGVDSHSNYYSIGLKELRLSNLRKNPTFEFSNFDLSDQDKFNQLVTQINPDTVFHLAAQAGVRIPIQNIDKYVDSNLLGFSKVLKACIINRVPNLLFASSSSVYGNEAAIPYTESEVNLKPSSFYGGTKLANEILARTLSSNSVTRVRGMRFFTVYGPMGRPDMAYFRIISSLIAKTNFELFGDGDIERDFTFIEDCVNVIALLQKELLSRENGYFDVVNVGGGHPVSMKKLISVTQDVTGIKLDYKVGPANNNDAIKTMADARYLISLVGVKPQTSLEEGIARTINWAKQPIFKEYLVEWAESSI